jgi:4-hydroxy-tetrahydrodipicolinate reductase
VEITNDPSVLLKRGAADVLLHATSYDPQRIAADVTPALAAGINVISISGVSFLRGRFPELARELDEAARRGGATLLGTGLNPGFVQDVLPITLSGACEEVTRVAATRVSDFSPWGPEVMRHYGIGLDEAEFRKGVADGSIGLHEEICQSVDMIAYALGWRLDDTRQEKTPLLTGVARRGSHMTIREGAVCGFRHRACGVRGGEAVIELELVGIVRPDPARDGVRLGTVVAIAGTPSVRVVAETGFGEAEEVYAATAARAVNAIPHVLKAPPGLVALPDLPIMAWWPGGI